MGIDFGLKRVGIAVSDELHIAISTEPTLIYSSLHFWDNLKKIILEKQIGGIILGVPFEKHEEHLMREHIENFEKRLLSEMDKLGLEISIEHQDESYSSKEAVYTMLEIGKKKKKRSIKGNIDAISAGLILRKWLDSNE